jgi:hypothetical protein
MLRSISFTTAESSCGEFDVDRRWIVVGMLLLLPALTLLLAAGGQQSETAAARFPRRAVYPQPEPEVCVVLISELRAWWCHRAPCLLLQLRPALH